LQNLGIDANSIAGQTLGALRTNNSTNKQEKPLLDSILEDISLERKKSQQQKAQVNQGFEKTVFKSDTKATMESP
jgi:hypothetical protein